MKNDLKVTRVTNPYISLTVVKHFDLEGESFSSGSVCLILGYTSIFFIVLMIVVGKNNK